MEQTLCYAETMTMSRCYSNPSSWGQNHDNLIKESRFSSQMQNMSHDFIHNAYVPTLEDGNDAEYEIEDEESEFKMGRLIRQASFNSFQTSPPQQTAKVMKGSSSLPRYLSEKPKTAQEKISSMRKQESMKERSSRSKTSMKLGKNYGGAPLIPGAWVDKGSSEDMKAQIKFWARAVASNVHQTEAQSLIRLNIMDLYVKNQLITGIMNIDTSTYQVLRSSPTLSVYAPTGFAQNACPAS